ncbi:hypothetical protein JCGZ_20299 [Jatropha curcas]|uniref:Uncharacterized protein n=1 Tax=Jatropha curcas TaxID=180498 RepID=A0A067JTM6_JATCU|nr:hypothetical protein JCGZ_20299 [Jatropha curcas]
MAIFDGRHEPFKAYVSTTNSIRNQALRILYRFLLKIILVRSSDTVGGLITFILDRLNIVAIDYCEKVIGKGEREKITMNALVTMKIIAKFEGYYYFRNKKCNVEGHPIAVVEEDADDVETDKEGEEHPSLILESTKKGEDPDQYFEDSQLHEEQYYEEDPEQDPKEDPKENLEKEPSLLQPEGISTPRVEE